MILRYVCSQNVALSTFLIMLFFGVMVFYYFFLPLNAMPCTHQVQSIFCARILACTIQKQHRFKSLTFVVHSSRTHPGSSIILPGDYRKKRKHWMRADSHISITLSIWKFLLKNFSSQCTHRRNPMLSIVVCARNFFHVSLSCGCAFEFRRMCVCCVRVWCRWVTHTANGLNIISRFQNSSIQLCLQHGKVRRPSSTHLLIQNGICNGNFQFTRIGHYTHEYHDFTSILFWSGGGAVRLLPTVVSSVIRADSLNLLLLPEGNNANMLSVTTN